MNDQDLLDLKQKIEEAKENLSKNEGRKEALMEQLQDRFGIKTLAEAKKKIKELEEEIEAQSAQIETATDELETLINERENPESTQPTRTRKRQTPSDSERSDRPKRSTSRQ
jgi:flagellar biosynthesis chaperone FliJ